MYLPGAAKKKKKNLKILKNKVCVEAAKMDNNNKGQACGVKDFWHLTVIYYNLSSWNETFLW